MAAARKTIATSGQFNYFHNSSFIPSTVDKCHQWTGSFLRLQVSILLIFSVESLELMAAQFLWKLYVAFPHEFTLSTKTNLLRVIFFTDTIYWGIQETTSPQISKTCTIHEKCPRTLNDSIIVSLYIHTAKKTTSLIAHTYRVYYLHFGRFGLQNKNLLSVLSTSFQIHDICTLPML